MGAATALHIALFVVLLATPARAPFGAVGPDMGTGMQVSLVSGFAAGSPTLGRPRLDLLRLSPDLPSAADAPAHGGAHDPRSEAPVKAQPPSRPAAAHGSQAPGRDGDAGGTAEGAQGATAAAGGDPLATSDLLAQVARCLDPGFRPALAYAQLTVQIGPDGRLQRPPQVSLALPALQGDRAVADRIVQAALLCGPYGHPDLAGRTISVAADFSQVPVQP